MEYKWITLRKYIAKYKYNDKKILLKFFIILEIKYLKEKKIYEIYEFIL